MYLLEPLINIYGGRVDAIGAKIEAFKYVIYRKKELFNLIYNYFRRFFSVFLALAHLNVKKR